MIRIIVFLLVFSVIIAVHELGHFLAARAMGIAVEEFYLGMGPVLFRVPGKHTVFSLRLLPIGGACVMKDEDAEQTADDSFNAKKPWQRFLTVLAGPVMNFVLAFLAAMVLVAAAGTDPAMVSSVTDGYPAQEAGISGGDRICSLDGRSVHLFREIQLYLLLHPGKPVTIGYVHENSRCETVLQPRLDEGSGSYRIGIVSTMPDVKPNGIPELLKFSFFEVRYNISAVFDSLAYLFTGRVTLDDFMGPVGLAGMMGDSVKEASAYGLLSIVITIVNFIVMLSSNLGVMNLLPFPALDGGRLVFLAAEMILGRPLNRKLEEYINLAGFGILIAFMMVIMVNDFFRLL